jgi:hypothetical protein
MFCIYSTNTEDPNPSTIEEPSYLLRSLGICMVVPSTRPHYTDTRLMTCRSKTVSLILYEDAHKVFLIFLLARVNLVYKNPTNNSHHLLSHFSTQYRLKLATVISESRAKTSPRDDGGVPAGTFSPTRCG